MKTLLAVALAVLLAPVLSAQVQEVPEHNPDGTRASIHFSFAVPNYSTNIRSSSGPVGYDYDAEASLQLKLKVPVGMTTLGLWYERGGFKMDQGFGSGNHLSTETSLYIIGGSISYYF